jgi:prepilin-type N-terminal cleavage/methylation domain-containing protein
LGTHKKNNIGWGFTLIELMVVIVIVSILASVAIPILRGRINEAKWSEGRAMIGTIARAIRAYHAEKGYTAPAPTAFGGPTGLGFFPGDLSGKYFIDADFTFSVTSMDPLLFTVTGTATTTTLVPPSYTLNQSGVWTP